MVVAVCELIAISRGDRKLFRPLVRQLPVQPTHDLFGIQPRHATIRDLTDARHHPLGALLGRTGAGVGMSVLASVAFLEGVAQ
jgi:hypothetical protein